MDSVFEAESLEIAAVRIYPFQSYLRWIRYSRQTDDFFIEAKKIVSILFEVDSVFEVRDWFGLRTR